MKRNHIIAMDTHCQWTEGVVMTEGGRITHRWQVPTTIPDLAEKITSVRHPRDVVFEEGPLADWLLRGLQPLADRIVVADPRRNHLIAKDSDKDDAIDAEKLAHLYRGGYIKPVHHPASWDRLVLKRQVALYHHQVKQRVRQANRIISELRHYGVMVREAAFRDPADRPGLLAPLPNDRAVRAGLECLWRGYDGAVEQGRQMGRESDAPGPRGAPGAAVRGVAGGEVDPGLDVLGLRGYAVAVSQQAGIVEVSGDWAGTSIEREWAGAGPGGSGDPSEAQEHDSRCGGVGDPRPGQPVRRTVEEVDRPGSIASHRASQRGSKLGGGDVGFVEERRCLPAGMGRPGGDGPARARGATERLSLA